MGRPSVDCGDWFLFLGPCKYVVDTCHIDRQDQDLIGRNQLWNRVFVFVFVFVFFFLFVFVSTTSMSMAVQCGRIGPEESAGVGRCEPQLRLSCASDAEQTTSIKSNQVYLECGEIPTNRKLVSKPTCCLGAIVQLCER